MPLPVPFTFAIPLIARRTARNWRRVQDLLGLTLASVRAQGDGDFRVVIAGHDRPDNLPADPRFEFVAVDWPAEGPRADNLDSSRKKHLIADLVLRRGGGLLMFLDADDWLDTRTVAMSRALIAPPHVGGLITRGDAIDLHTRHHLPLPHPRAFDGGFHRLCGSSIVVRLDPEHPSLRWRNPYGVLHDHHAWIETAEAEGVEIADLPLRGGYVVNTSENHSELHGPFADWRRQFSAAIAAEGRLMDAPFVARFGLTPTQVEAVAGVALSEPP